jgi:hypothetical protein
MSELTLLTTDPFFILINVMDNNNNNNNDRFLFITIQIIIGRFGNRLLDWYSYEEKYYEEESVTIIINHVN